MVMVTDTFSQKKNQAMTTAEAIAAVEAIAPRARAAGLPVSVTLSASFGCPWRGEAECPGWWMDVARRRPQPGSTSWRSRTRSALRVPRDAHRRTSAVRDAVDVPLRVHVHNTRNTGYARVHWPAADAGVAVLDARSAGSADAPSPRATGNIATEDLVFAWNAPATTPGSTWTPCAVPVTGLRSRRQPDTGLVAKARGSTSRLNGDRRRSRPGDCPWQ